MLGVMNPLLKSPTFHEKLPWDYKVLNSDETTKSSYLVVSETAKANEPFFSFFPEPDPLVPLLCFGGLQDFLDEGESLELNSSGEAWGMKM